MSKLDIKDEAEKWASDAIGLAKVCNINLDYLEDSIEELEKLCDFSYNHFKERRLESMKNKKEEERIKQIIDRTCLMIGGYLGKIIVDNIGGDWRVLEDNLIVIVFSNKTVCYPIAKVYKRIINGKEDDIVFYYKTLKNNIVNR